MFRIIRGRERELEATPRPERPIAWIYFYLYMAPFHTHHTLHWTRPWHQHQYRTRRVEQQLRELKEAFDDQNKQEEQKLALAIHDYAYAAR